MSKAFTKEDDEIPERVSRERSVSGLPPGAANYMTGEGARRLRGELEELQPRAMGSDAERVAGLQRTLDSATIVPARETAPEEVLFGTTVTIRTAQGELHRHRIVGVDEAALADGWVSWVSPLAKALFGARVGQQITLPDATKAQIVEIAP